jgi:dihydroflavonol-4-reductase
MREAMKGADIVFHNAGWYELGISESSKGKMQAINVEGTKNVLNLANELGIKRVVYTSSCVAIGDTGGITVDETFKRVAPVKTYYEQTKVEAHEIALHYPNVIVACPAQVIGVNDHSPFGYYAWLYVRNLLPPIIWAPDGCFTFVHVADVAEGIALAGDKGKTGEIYFFGAGSIILRDLMQVWKEAVGGIPPFIWLPKPLALAQGMIAEIFLRLIGASAFISREAVESSYVSFRFSGEKAKRELGWTPRDAKQAWMDTLRGEKIKSKK